MLFAGFVARTREGRLPRRVVFGKLVEGKGYSGGQEKALMVRLEKYMMGFGMKFEGQRKAAQMAGIWFRRVVEGAEAFMRNGMTRRAVELQSDTPRSRQRHPPSTSILRGGKGGGEGGGDEGRAGVLPKRLRSGSGHHRPEVCVPSHGRK